MESERTAKKIILTLLFLALLPSIMSLIIHVVHDVVSQPSPVDALASNKGHSEFGAGVLVTILILLMVVGLLTRIGRALQNPDAARYRAVLDRRARTLPRYSAEADEVGAHGAGPAPVDDDPELPWD